jgi:hypothetical protein
VRTGTGRAGVFDDDDIVGPGSELLGTLRRVQKKLRADSKLPFFELTQTAVNRSQISVDKKDVKRSMPVDMRILRAHTLGFRTGLALCQVCHSAGARNRPWPPIEMGIGGMEIDPSRSD